MRVPMIDLHCDTVRRIYEGDRREGLRENSLHVDLTKLSRSGSMAQVFALYIDLANDGDPWTTYEELREIFFAALRRNEDLVSLAKDSTEMEGNRAAGRLSAFLAVEEGGVLKGEIENLRHLYRHGVRLLTLTWNYPNALGYPSADGCGAGGLTAFGREVVREMNRLGMIIDASHLSDSGFFDLLRLSRDPVVASHSNARSVCAHHRNLDDAMIRALAEGGGVTGINLCSHFIAEDGQDGIADIVRHIDHIRKTGGIGVLALGTDFDGIPDREELVDTGEMPGLILELKRKNYTDDEIEDIWYRNAKRVIQEVL